MPTYDYLCEANGRVVEARHAMKDTVATWGELCALTGMTPGDTPGDAPVQRLVTGGQVVRSTSLGDAAAPPCASGPCCGGVCGVQR
jgi:hypothetical protein